MKRRWYLLIALVVIILIRLGLSSSLDNNPLKKYGFSYDMTVGDDGVIRIFNPYLDINGKRIKGPTIDGDFLAVKYREKEPGEPPEIVVYEDDKREKEVYAVLKLNFTDPDNPKFDVIENENLSVYYNYPWEDNAK